MAKHETMNLIQFQKRFVSDDACQDHLFSMKWPNGYVCEKCGHNQYYTTKTRKLNLYECKQCRYQATVTVGTVMEKTRTDLTKWFLAIFLVAHDKRGVSATMLSEELDITYKTAWLILHKIRKAMGKRDASYSLAGIVELDDAFFGAPTEGGKRGRGTEKATVLVGLSLNERGHPQYAKMEVIPDVKGSTLVKFANESIQPGSTINSDAYRSYRALAKEGFQHEPKEFNPVENPDHLQWLHTIISNVKAFLAGTYHGLGEKHLQAYLNEFCYRFNRRKFRGEGFNRLLSCCASARTITYSELVG
ncbi:IS1595 family transposase [Paenibacillus sp. MBLB2552]|uniref:IS1595 family transposase n=1 Tax=Paenibacillus mellifer TaxID=2937794 RepID=A0A9X2BNN8_9BACL|nr:IS1595 family transposase [Paenibacillus mellifer]MCK8487069.1 IS1595 family transposase [Paenibacillus mellifer]